MNKLAHMYRRFRLGKKHKHQHRCHASFGLIRNKENVTVTWKKDHIATVSMVSELRNKFSKNCFIIATGPSLKEIDLSRLAPFDSISLNCAIRKFSDSHLVPTHCVIVDHRVFDNHWQCVKDSILSGTNCFFSFVGLSRICEREPELLKNNNIYLLEGIARQFGKERPTVEEFYHQYGQDNEVFSDDDFPRDRGTIGFSCNAEKGVFTGKTVATWAVQLACHLGYQNQFIAGMDLGGTGKSHFYDNGNNPPPDFLRDYEPVIRTCFEQVRRASEKRGFSVYNLSKHSTLTDEIIPKISYNKALSLAANDTE